MVRDNINEALEKVREHDLQCLTGGCTRCGAILTSAQDAVFSMTQDYNHVHPELRSVVQSNITKLRKVADVAVETNLHARVGDADCVNAKYLSQQLKRYKPH